MYSAEETVYTKSHIAARDIPAEYLQYYNLGRAKVLSPLIQTIGTTKKVV